MNCKHEFKSVDSAMLFIGNEMRMIDSYQCIHCSKWYFMDREKNKRITFHDGYKGEEVESEFE